MNIIEARFTLVTRARQFSQLSLLAAFAAACGSTSVTEPNDKGISSIGGQDDQTAGAGGNTAGSGSAGATAGSAGAIAAGTGGTAGDGAAGMGASAGSIGGAGSGGGGGSAGMGLAGSAGMGLAGSAGNSSVCHARPPQPCGGGAITLPRSCVSEDMATVGTSLPVATCRTMCETMFASCNVSAVTQTNVTVLCNTFCPTAQP